LMARMPKRVSKRARIDLDEGDRAERRAHVMTRFGRSDLREGLLLDRQLSLANAARLRVLKP